ncbi:MAG TPA: site-2 protease family protein [Noviherbaspirillum sp.]
MDEIIRTIAVYALPVIFAITLHEAAHAYAARYFGDSTAYMQGRMSLNPIKHVDPFGTVILPLILALIPGAIVFGYAKPVPIDYGNLKKPKRDMAWVALAGPAANLVMAAFWLVFFQALRTSGVDEPFFFKVAQAGVFTNLVIFAFNLFPMPPLDGGRVLTSMLPHRYAYKFAQIEPYGFFIVLALLYFKILNFWMQPMMQVAAKFLEVVTLPLTIFLN